jgi:hypothetical protein
MEKKMMTPWFHHKTKPVRTGVYEVFKPAKNDPTLYAYFDVYRNIWGYASTSVKAAKRNLGNLAIQNKDWRGFTEEQK